MKGKGKPKGSKKRKQARAKSYKAKKNMNLAKREQPTERGYFHGSEKFDKRLEEITIEETFLEIKFAKLAAFRAKLRAGPTSPVALSVTGILGNPVLHATHAPEWAQLGVVILPWGIALSWRALERGHGALARRGELKQGRARPGPGTAAPPAPAET